MLHLIIWDRIQLLEVLLIMESHYLIQSTQHRKNAGN